MGSRIPASGVAPVHHIYCGIMFLLFLMTMPIQPLEAVAGSISFADDLMPIVDQDGSQVEIDLSEDTARLQHLRVVHSSTIAPQGNSVDDRIFVAGVNRLWSLSGSNLNILERVVTGPKPDNSDECSAAGCRSGASTSPTDNHNKVLVVDDVGGPVGHLLVCGSLFQGACRRYQLANLTGTSERLSQAVAANDEVSSTVAFIGPQRYRSWSGGRVLYVATTFTLAGAYRNSVPAISTRNLADLQLQMRSITEHSQLTIDVKYRDHFLVDYIYGFNTSSHVYFLTVQRRSHLPGHQDTGYISRIARVCVSDPNYISYVEMTVACDGANLLQAAYLAPAGRNLRNDRRHMRNGRHVLVAAFGTSDGAEREPLAEAGTRVCVIPVATIERMFDENIHRCFNGSQQYRNMEYVSGPVLDGKCPQPGTSGNVQDFCSVGLKLSAERSLVQPAALTLRQRVTSVAVSYTGRHTVALLGTASGQLIKVLIESVLRATPFSRVIVEDNTTILADSTVDSTGQFYYALTEHKVLKLPLASCEQHSNCSTCLGSRNPYCGWCALEGRCTVREECTRLQHYSQRWLTFDTHQQCIHIDHVHPSSIALDQPAQVTLKVSGLPDLTSDTGHYQCVFGSAPPVTATPTDDGLHCVAPPPRLRPFVDLTSDHVTVPLALRSSLTGRELVRTEFVYFQCTRHVHCGACVTSRWKCQWCVLDNTCIQHGSTCSLKRPGIIAAGYGTKVRSPTELGCPSVVQPERRIYLPSGTANRVTIEMVNLPPVTSSTTSPSSDSFTCVSEIDGKSTTVPARVQAGRFIVCDKHKYEYSGNMSSVRVNVTIIWNSRHSLGVAEVWLYKCQYLATHQSSQDCSLCLSHTNQFRCHWCGGECQFADQCRSPSLTTCPKPRITKISPISGPAEGGTLITIDGHNLGLSRAEVANGVTVAGLPCQLVEYNVSVRLVCRTAAIRVVTSQHGSDVSSGSEVVRRGAVELVTNAGHATSDQLYSYLRVGVMGVYPTYGPISGGTQLTLIGSNLASGSQLRVGLDDHPCHVLTRSPNVTCMTSSVHSAGMVSRLAVWLDSANHSTFTTFTYRPDPVLFDIRPLKSYFSGGRLLAVHGEHLDSVQSPRLFIFNHSVEQPINSTACRIISNRLMECPSPSLSGANLEPTQAPTVRSQHKNTRTAAWHQSSGPTVTVINNNDDNNNNNNNIYLKVGFVMDNVESVRRLEQFFPNVPSTLMYIPDPVLFPFASRRKVLTGRTLVIEGRDLNTATDLSETRVLVGSEPCNVTSLTSTQVTCEPPLQSPAGDHTGNPVVHVQLGSLQFTLGYLVYTQRSSFPITSASVVGGIAGGSVLLLCLALVTLLLYRHKSSQVEREYKRIQIQMDTLENNIRSECKQSFAAMCTWDPQRARDPAMVSTAATGPDLRTQLNNMINQFSPDEVACVEQREFLRKVLFPGVSDHPIFSQEPYTVVCPYSFEDESLKKLDCLVRQHEFIDVFVHTLESQKDFNVRDRVTVASLLSVILMNDMEYMTAVLQILLKKHITRLASTKHPHLMLRRTETIVEKLLTNWISLCLYNYIEVKLAPPLHLLTRAVKCQMDAGPVDAVSQDAQFSIAEDRLLHEHIDYNPVTLLVTAEELPYEQVATYGGSSISYSHQHQQQQHYEDLVHRATVHALSCDTISQAKQKIIGHVFCNVPASARPSHHAFTLLWQRGDGQRVMLSDEDVTVKCEAGWRRINTLQHYGIINIATVSLVQARDALNLSTYLPSSSSGVSVPSSFSPLSSSNIYVRPGVEPRVFHLTRPPTSPDLYNRKSATVPEVFLTRQLSNKAMLQTFIDNVMSALFSVDDEFPAVIKWLFDTLDQQAEQHEISDPEVVHSWKANCVPLRLWANLVRRPELIFDMDKSSPVEASLAVISQSLVEACLPTAATITRDSAAYRLLFAKDVVRWRHLVSECFTNISQLPAVDSDRLSQQLRLLSEQLVRCQFKPAAALRELHVYVSKYGQQLLQQLKQLPPPPTDVGEYVVLDDMLEDILSSS